MNAKQLENIAMKKCKVELESVGVTFKEDLNWEFKINNHKTSFGECHYKKRENKMIISLSKYLFKNMTNNETNPIDTITHELIHASGVWGHGKEFKRIARLVNNKYGYNIQRTNKAEIGDDKYNYIIQCKTCGSKRRKYRKSKKIKHYKDYRCGCCGGEFERIK